MVSMVTGFISVYGLSMKLHTQFSSISSLDIYMYNNWKYRKFFS